MAERHGHAPVVALTLVQGLQLIGFHRERDAVELHPFRGLDVRGGVFNRRFVELVARGIVRRPQVEQASVAGHGDRDDALRVSGVVADGQTERVLEEFQYFPLSQLV